MKHTHFRTALCCLIALLCIAYTYVPARADTDAADYTVYIAPFSGQRYHSMDDCSGLLFADRTEAVSLAYAAAHGYTPCQICAKYLEKYEPVAIPKSEPRTTVSPAQPSVGSRFSNFLNARDLNVPSVILLAVTAVAAVWMSVRGICRGMREQAAKRAAKRAAAAQKSYDILSPDMMCTYREPRTLPELDTRPARPERLAAPQAEQSEQAARDMRADEPASIKHQSIHGITFEVDGYKQRELDRRCEALPSATIDNLSSRLNDAIEFNEVLCSFLCTLWAVIGLLGRFNLELMAIGTAVHYCIGWALQRTNIVMASAALRACLRIHYALAKNLLHLLLPAACALVMGSIKPCLYVYIPYFACMLARFIITIPMHDGISRRTGRIYRRPTRTANNAIDYLLRNMPRQ